MTAKAKTAWDELPKQQQDLLLKTHLDLAVLYDADILKAEFNAMSGADRAHYQAALVQLEERYRTMRWVLDVGPMFSFIDDLKALKDSARLTKEQKAFVVRKSAELDVAAHRNLALRQYLWEYEADFDNRMSLWFRKEHYSKEAERPIWDRFMDLWTADKNLPDEHIERAAKIFDLMLNEDGFSPQQKSFIKPYRDNALAYADYKNGERKYARMCQQLDSPRVYVGDAGISFTRHWLALRAA